MAIFNIVNEMPWIIEAITLLGLSQQSLNSIIKSNVNSLNKPNFSDLKEFIHEYCQEVDC